MKERLSNHSSFGLACPECGHQLIAPEWSELWNERQIHHVWHCWKCDYCFESHVVFPANANSMEHILTQDYVFPSLLVA
jgi:hypothetical protein